jgi:hypothetical protein
VTLTVDASIAGATVRLTAANTGTTTIHVFDCEAMPYLWQDGDGLLVLHGMHEPPEESDHWGVEVPNTRPLAPGDVLRGEVSFDPLWVHSHYGTGDRFVDLATPTRIRTAVGWGATPIDDRAAVEMGLNVVCRQWQQLTCGPDLAVPGGLGRR